MGGGAWAPALRGASAPSGFRSLGFACAMILQLSISGANIAINSRCFRDDPAGNAVLLPPGMTPVFAAGDPHVANVLGERFDILERKTHVLVQIPRGAAANETFLRIEAKVTGGEDCEVAFFSAFNITGLWARTSVGRAMGFFYAALPWGKAKQRSPRAAYQQFGPVRVRVTYATMASGLPYLNLHITHLKDVPHEIGGLLGIDDHTLAATKPSDCTPDPTYATNISRAHHA